MTDQPDTKTYLVELSDEKINVIIERVQRRLINDAIAAMQGDWWKDISAKLFALRAAAGDNEQVPKGYAVYMQSKEWKAKREKILQAYGNRCAVCFSTENLQIHHRDYDYFKNESASNCIVLCEFCHACVHPFGQLPRQWFDKNNPLLLDNLKAAMEIELQVRLMPEEYFIREGGDG